MKCIIPEISWHNREPVLSVHLQPISEKFYRLATGGADCHVLIWQLVINENGAVKIEALSDLTRHQRAVNSVRWSPSGQYLATADDDANIIIWQLKTDNIPLLEGETNDRETWIVHKVMRGHKEDIYDLCWSPNGLKLLSGSIDNTAILWDFTKGKSENILTDHKGFVQGVTWDPKGLYLATISTDRICRIYESSGKQVKARLQKGCLSVPSDHYLHNKDVKFFHDDTFKSFFRRLAFSPDGALLAVPSGRIEVEDCKKTLNATLIFAVESWARPIAVLPSGKQFSTVVRFCPILFELHEKGPDPIVSLPFRMIIAVGTDHDVILYDTQQMQPFAYFKDIHYTRLTDLTWSSDGLLLVASSTDGYCALITFEPQELGVQYVKEESEVEESVLDVSGCEELDKEESAEFVKPKKLNLLEQWTVKTPKKSTAAKNTIEDDTSKRKREDEPGKSEVLKRIKPIPVEDKKAEGNNKDNISIKIKDPSPKASPLVNFLKKATKGKADEPKKAVPGPPPVNLILDVEARDAWKCEKEEIKSSDTKVVHVDECTEDFSLHLDDTNSKTNTEKNCVHGKDSTEVKENKEERKDKELTDTNELEDDKQNEQQSDKKSVQNKDTQVEEVTLKNSEKIINKTPSTNSEDKSNIPKRRIPLITLSSPKHKKK